MLLRDYAGLGYLYTYMFLHMHNGASIGVWRASECLEGANECDIYLREIGLKIEVIY